MMPLNNASPAFEQRYASHLKHLKLQGLQTKTVDAYARAIRTMGEHFDWRIDTLSEDQLTDYFHQRADHAVAAGQVVRRVQPRGEGHRLRRWRRGVHRRCHGHIDDRPVWLGLRLNRHDVTARE